MVTVTRICKNCGKEYKTCPNPKVNAGEYRWQDVACSPECGAAYLAAVLESRGLAPKKEPVSEEAAPAEADPGCNSGGEPTRKKAGSKRKRSS